MGVESKAFILMNKDKEILEFNYVIEDEIFSYCEEVSDFAGKSPYGFKDIESWLNNRKSPASRKFLDFNTETWYCDKLLTYLQLTHAVSLNDTYWVKSKDENISWNNISPYKNKFSDVVANLAFSVTGDVDTVLEYSTGGVFPKCWRYSDGDIKLYKGGSTKKGFEPKLETIASRVYDIICTDATTYDLGLFVDRVVSICDLFTDEQYGIVTLDKLFDRQPKYNELLDFMAKYNSSNLFAEMLIADAITLNVDRHLGNVAMKVNNDTGEIIGLSKVYDYNKALLPDLAEEIYSDRGKFKSYIRSAQPRIGLDFFNVAKSLLSLHPELVDRVRQVKDEFDCRKLKVKLEEWRLDAINEIICDNCTILLEEKREKFSNQDLTISKFQQLECKVKQL